MILRREAVLAWRLVQTVALIAYCSCGMLRGRLGRPVDLVAENFVRPTGVTGWLGV